MKLWNNEQNMDTSAEAQFLLMDSGTETLIISDSVIDYLYVCVLISAALYVFFSCGRCDGQQSYSNA